MSKFSGTSSWTTYTTDGPADNFVRALAIDNTGAQWFGTGSRGVSKFEPSTSTWTTYTTADGLVSNLINTIIFDNANTLWVGTWYGASKFDGTTWTPYTTAEGLVGNTVYAVAIDNAGNIWFGTGSGVSEFDGVTGWTTYTTSNGLANNTVKAVAIDRAGVKWFGTQGGGVSKLISSTWTTYTTSNGLASNSVSAIAIDDANVKWFGTVGGGVSRFDGTTWTTYTTADGLASNYVSTITIDSHGAVWVGAGNGGLSKFDGSTWTTYTTADGLVGDTVYAIATGNDNAMWFGTTNGANKLVEYANAFAPGTNFVHTTASGNIVGNYTKIDSSATNGNPNAMVFITHNYNPNGSSGSFYDYEPGVWYYNSAFQWNIFNEDWTSPMPPDVSFNVFVPSTGADAFVHTAASGNITGNYTLIDNPATNNNPNAMLFVTQNWNPGGSGGEIYNDHPIGVWYSPAGKWSVFNQDGAAMPNGAAFNVFVPPPGTDVFIHTALSGNIVGTVTYIDHPLTNNRPGAMLLVTQNWNPGGTGGTYNNRHIGVAYDSTKGKWNIFNEDGASSMPEHASFNVAVILYRVYLPLIMR